MRIVKCQIRVWMPCKRIERNAFLTKPVKRILTSWPIIRTPFLSVWYQIAQRITFVLCFPLLWGKNCWTTAAISITKQHRHWCFYYQSSSLGKKLDFLDITDFTSRTKQYYVLGQIEVLHIIKLVLHIRADLLHRIQISWPF